MLQTQSNIEYGRFQLSMAITPANGPGWGNVGCRNLYACSVYLKVWWQSDPK